MSHIASAKTVRLSLAEWSENFPTEPGWYWFYGRRFRGKYVPTLMPVHAVKSANDHNICLTMGAVIYRSEAEGLWLPMTLPELPHEGLQGLFTDDDLKKAGQDWS